MNGGRSGSILLLLTLLSGLALIGCQTAPNSQAGGAQPACLWFCRTTVEVANIYGDVTAPINSTKTVSENAGRIP